jgi:hypothetical protein
MLHGGLAQTKILFSKECIERNLHTKFGLTNFEVELPFDKDCIRFSVRTPNHNVISAEVDQIDIEMHRSSAAGIAHNIHTAITVIENYLNKNPGV